MNSVILIGNLARDNELKEAKSTKYVNNALAINKPAKEGKSNTIFVNFTAFGKTAELLAQYTGKGSKIALDGRVDVNTYEKDGKKHSSTVIIADRIEFLSSAKKEQESDIPNNLDDVEDLPFD